MFCFRRLGGGRVEAVVAWVISSMWGLERDCQGYKVRRSRVCIHVV